MMPWLLKNDGYPASITIAVMLHVLLMWILVDRAPEPRDLVKIDRPSITANTVALNPQEVKQKKKAQQQQAARTKERQEQQRKQEQAKREVAEKQKQEDKKQDDQKKLAEQQKAEQLKKEQATAQKKKDDEQKKVAEAEARKREQERVAKEQAQREEASKAEAAFQSAMGQEQQMVADYSDLIRSLIEEQWHPPITAKEGMLAVLELKLVPTGEIISSRIVESSGDIAYDRTIEQAVKRVGSFPELKDVPPEVFNRHLRTVTIGFRPEDLLP
jgi:colicin import membrane protein